MGDTNWLSRVSRQLSSSTERSRLALDAPTTLEVDNTAGQHAQPSSVLPVMTSSQSQEPHRPRRFTVTEHPEFFLTHSSQFPDKLKMRKLVSIWPLRFKLRADYCRTSRSFEYGCSCKDSILGGRIRLDIPRQGVEYTKLLPLGNAGIAMAARCSYSGILHGHSTFRPHFEFQYVFGGGAARWAGNQFDVRQKLRLTRTLAVEACGNIQVPTPMAEYAMEETHNTVRVGDGAFHAHLAQLNLILEL